MCTLLLLQFIRHRARHWQGEVCKNIITDFNETTEVKQMHLIPKRKF